MPHICSAQGNRVWRTWAFVAAFAVCVVLAGIGVSRAQTGMFMTPTPMDLTTLADAMQADPAALARFDDITELIAGADPGGQNLVNIMITELQNLIGTPPTTTTVLPWVSAPGTPTPPEGRANITGISAANPAVVTYDTGGGDFFTDGQLVAMAGVTGLPDGLYSIDNAGGGTFELVGIDGATITGFAGATATTPALDVTLRAAAGDLASLQMLQVAFANRRGEIEAAGYTPSDDTDPMTAVNVSNIGIQAMGWIVGGRGLNVLETIGQAMLCPPPTVDGSGNPVPPACPTDESRGAWNTLDAIMLYCNVPVADDPLGSPPIPVGTGCKQHHAYDFLTVMNQTVAALASVAGDAFCAQAPTPCTVLCGAPITAQGTCTPVSMSTMIAVSQNPADATSTIAGQTLSTALDLFLNGISDCPPHLPDPRLCDPHTDPSIIYPPDPSSGGSDTSPYIGQTAIDYLGEAVDLLPAPLNLADAGTTDPGPDVQGRVTMLNFLPSPGGGIYDVPTSSTPGYNSGILEDSGVGTAEPGCIKEGQEAAAGVEDGEFDYTDQDVRIQWLSNDWFENETGDGPADFGTDPCRFTRDVLGLNFAQNYKAGEQWGFYFGAWVENQWLPALKSMTAQWSAAIIAQTLLYGSVLDASLAARSQIEIQKAEAKKVASVSPSEQSCTLASASMGVPSLTIDPTYRTNSSMASIQQGSNAMTGAFRRSMRIQAGTGTAP